MPPVILVCEYFDACELIEIDKDSFAIVFLQFDTIDPDLVILGMGEPGSCLLLFVVEDRSLKRCGQRATFTRNLLRDAHPLSRFVFGLLHGHGAKYMLRHSPRGISPANRR